jgi:hypothetical protein
LQGSIDLVLPGRFRLTSAMPTLSSAFTVRLV